MQIIKKLLPLKEYFQGNFKKTRICLHHTMGYGASGSIDWWKEQPDKVGTAYLIDRDGLIWQAFDDKCYAYQFGLSGVSRRIEFEESTIGIELCNLGPLTKLQNGEFADQYGKKFKGNVHKEKYRGYEYWEEYTEEQYKSLNILLGMLSIKYNLKINPVNHINFDLTTFDKFTVITHSNVRKDKTDVSPAFDWLKINPQLPF